MRRREMMREASGGARRRQEEALLLLHARLRDAAPLELSAHVSRVASCAVVTNASTSRAKHDLVRGAADDVCVVSGDAVGNLSVFYLCVRDLCIANERDAGAEPTAVRPRVRPDVKHRGAHRGSINCMRHLRASTQLVTGGDDGVVRVWNLAQDHVKDNKLQCIRELLFHTSCVLACDTDASSTVLATAGLDGVVALWLLHIPIPLLTIAVHKPCFSVSIVREDPSLLVVAHEDNVTVWDIRAQPHYMHFQRALSTHVQSLVAQSTLPAARRSFLARLMAAFPDESASIWHMRHDSEAKLQQLDVVDAIASGVVGARRVFDETSRRYVRPFSKHEAGSGLRSTSLVLDGRAVLTSGSDYQHKLWNVATQQGIASFEPASRALSKGTGQQSDLAAGGTICHCGRFLYGADAAGDVFVWDLARVASLAGDNGASLVPTHSIRGHSYFVTSIALSEDDVVLATGDASGKLHLRAARVAPASIEQAADQSNE